MPKTTPVPEFLKKSVHQIHSLHPETSARQIAKQIGLHHKTVSRIIKQQEVDEIVQGIQADEAEPISHEAVRQALRKGPLSTEDLATALKASPESVETSIADNEAQADLLHYKTKAKSLESNIKDLLKERGKYKSLVDDLKTAIIASEPYPHVPVLVRPTSSSPVSAVLKLSDWQIGEVIQAAETEGFGEFNFAIAERRVFDLIKSFLGWVDMHRKAGHNIQTLHIFSEADLVSGNIHYELEVTNEFPVTVASVKAGMLLAETVSQLSAHFEKTVVWEMSADNHGRLTRKSQAKQGALNNYSYVAHVVCNEVLKQHDSVEVHMGEGTKLLAEVSGKKFLISHGHHIMGQMGIPYYGMERDRAREAVKRQNTDKSFDYISIGHWHVPAIISGNILVNGSLTGTTEFDHMSGRHALPSQVSFMVHPTHGLFNWTAWRLG